MRVSLSLGRLHTVIADRIRRAVSRVPLIPWYKHGGGPRDNVKGKIEVDRRENLDILRYSSQPSSLSELCRGATSPDITWHLWRSLKSMVGKSRITILRHIRPDQDLLSA